MQFIAEAINSNNEELKMKNEKLWKGSALTRLYIRTCLRQNLIIRFAHNNAGRSPLNYSFFIIHYSFNFSLSLRDKLKLETGTHRFGACRFVFFALLRCFGRRLCGGGIGSVLGIRSVPVRRLCIRIDLPTHADPAAAVGIA